MSEPAAPALPPRFPVTAAEVERVVAAFYAGVREHPVLGPVFAVHVRDWPAHEAKVAAFWRNAIQMERGGYDGSPMAAHLRAGNVRPGMFDPWLALFDRTLAAELPPETARSWSALAHRIGQGLRYGVVDMPKKDGVPLLR